MPTYVGLGQTGFYEPYKMLQEGLSRSADRRQQQQLNDRRHSLALSELEQRKLQDELQRKNWQSMMDARDFELGQAKKGVMRQDALNSFDPSSVHTPEIPIPLKDSRASQGFDPSQPWHNQDPAVRSQAAMMFKPLGIGEDQIAQRFNQLMTANTGQPVVPQAPPGMRLGKLDMGPASYIPDYTNGAGAAGASPQIRTIDTAGGGKITQILDTKTGQWETAHPSYIGSDKKLTGEEAEKLNAFNTVRMQIHELEKELGKVNGSTRGPIAGLQHTLNPWDTQKTGVDTQWQMMMLNLARALGEKGVISDQDSKRWLAVKPGLRDSPEQAAIKIRKMQDNLDQSYNNTLKNFGMAGRDVSKFNPQPLNPAGSAGGQPQQQPSPAQQPTSESPESIKAGFKAGLLSLEEAEAKLKALGFQ